MARKTRTFTGCKTCRSRKVKCDLTRPQCLRCERAKLKCGGYSLELGWASPLTVVQGQLMSLGEGDDDKFQRRNVELVTFPQGSRYYTFKELSEAIERVNGQSGKGSQAQVGPFCVFPVGELKTNKRRASPSSRASSVSSKKRRPPTTSIFSKTDNSYVHYELVNSAKLTIVAIKGARYQFNEQNMFHILYPKFFPNVDSDDWLADKTVMHQFCGVVGTGADANVVVKLLLRRVMTDLSGTMFPFITLNYRQNYYDTILKVYIRSIISEFVNESLLEWMGLEIDPEKDYEPHILDHHLKMGVIYLILLISMFQMASINRLGPFVVDDHLQTSIELRKLGMQIVNYHLDEFDTNDDKMAPDSSYDVLMLLAIVVSITIDQYFGVFENFELLYAIGDFIIKTNFSSKKHLSSLLKYLVNVFKLMSIFYESTQSINHFNYSISKHDEEVNYGDLHEDYDLIQDSGDDSGDDSELTPPKVDFSPQNTSYSPMSFTISFDKRTALYPDEPNNKQHVVTPRPNHTSSIDPHACYLMYGLPQDLVELFHEIVHLTNHKNIFRQRRIQPRNFPKICADLEDRLVHWDVSDVWNFYEKKSFILRVHEAAWYYVRALHQAMVVYFHRLIKELPIAKYQTNIRESLLALQHVLDMKDDEELCINPLFWPILVCGCDIDLDDPECRPMKDWCEQMWSHGHYNRFNYWRLKQILFEVWKRRLEGEDHSFMDLVREWGIVLSL